MEPLHVTFGIFAPIRPEEAPGRVMRIAAAGRHFQARAIPVIARVGSQPVLDLILNPGGTGFVGFLARQPQPGDRLFVSYLDHEEIPTSVVYEPPSVV